MKHPNEKEAKDAAQAETAKGKQAVKHPENALKGVPKHYHPVDGKGNLKPKHHDIGSKAKVPAPKLKVEGKEVLN